MSFGHGGESSPVRLNFQCGNCHLQERGGGAWKLKHFAKELMSQSEPWFTSSNFLDSLLAILFLLVLSIYLLTRCRASLQLCRAAAMDENGWAFLHEDLDLKGEALIEQLKKVVQSLINNTSLTTRQLSKSAVFWFWDCFVVPFCHRFNLC